MFPLVHQVLVIRKTQHIALGFVTVFCSDSFMIFSSSFGCIISPADSFSTTKYKGAYVLGLCLKSWRMLIYCWKGSIFFKISSLFFIVWKMNKDYFSFLWMWPDTVFLFHLPWNVIMHCFLVSFFSEIDRALIFFTAVLIGDFFFNCLAEVIWLTLLPFGVLELCTLFFFRWLYIRSKFLSSLYSHLLCIQ